MKVIALLFVLALSSPAYAWGIYCPDCSDYQQQMLELQQRQTEALEEQNKRQKEWAVERGSREDGGFLPGGPPFPSVLSR